MTLNDLMNNRQPQTCSVRKAGDEGFKDLLELVRCQAVASIRETDPGNFRPSAVEFGGQRASIRHGLQSVVADVPENLANLVRIHRCHHGLVRQPPFHAASPSQQRVVLQQQEGLLHQVHQVGRPKLATLFASVHQKVGNQLVQAGRLAASENDELRLVLVQVGDSGQQLDRTSYGSEGIANFVRDSSRQATQGCHAVLGPVFGFTALLLCEVLKGVNVAYHSDLGYLQGGGGNT